MKCSLGLYEKAFPNKTEIEEMLRISKKHGFDFLELNIDKSKERINRLYDSNFLNRIIESTKKTDFPIEQIGISALSTYTLGNTDIEIRKKGIDILRRSITLAKNLGCRLIQIPACDVPKGSRHSKESNKEFINNLTESVEFASKEGVLIGIENMEDYYADTIEKCLKITEQINSPYLKIYPDSGNLTNAFEGDLKQITRDLKIGSGNLVAFHLKEVRKEKYGGLFYGDGIVKFEELVKRAYHSGSRRFVMEYWYTGNKEWEKEIEQANKLIYKWIEGIE